MRFLEKMLRKLEKNSYDITEEEIEEQLNKYDKYKNDVEEDYIVQIKRDWQFDEIINQVSNQVYTNNTCQNNEYNEYNNGEGIWTSLKAS